tara:strand:- start:7829 stop:8437 length:609 start_codon:yes stop_codon:yes gene_type:complete
MLIVIPKGRLLGEIKSLLSSIGINFDDSSRKLILDTSKKDVKVAILRSWDIPKFVNKGIADIGFLGKDVLNEASDSENYYEIMDLKLGLCRLSLASTIDISKIDKPIVATKYPKTSEKYFNEKFKDVEIISLKGAIEIAPILGLSDCIVDLVQTGKTLKENGLKELDVIAQITSRVIVNKSSFKKNADFYKKIFKSLEDNIE